MSEKNTHSEKERKHRVGKQAFIVAFAVATATAALTIAVATSGVKTNKEAQAKYEKAVNDFLAVVPRIQTVANRNLLVEEFHKIPLQYSDASYRKVLDLFKQANDFIQAEFDAKIKVQLDNINSQIGAVKNQDAQETKAVVDKLYQLVESSKTPSDSLLQKDGIYNEGKLLGLYSSDFIPKFNQPLNLLDKLFYSENFTKQADDKKLNIEGKTTLLDALLQTINLDVLKFKPTNENNLTKVKDQTIAALTASSSALDDVLSRINIAIDTQFANFKFNLDKSSEYLNNKKYANQAYFNQKVIEFKLDLQKLQPKLQQKDALTKSNVTDPEVLYWKSRYLLEATEMTESLFDQASKNTARAMILNSESINDFLNVLKYIEEKRKSEASMNQQKLDLILSVVKQIKDSAKNKEYQNKYNALVQPLSESMINPLLSYAHALLTEATTFTSDQKSSYQSQITDFESKLGSDFDEKTGSSYLQELNSIVAHMENDLRSLPLADFEAKRLAAKKAGLTNFIKKYLPSLSLDSLNIPTISNDDDYNTLYNNVMSKYIDLFVATHTGLIASRLANFDEADLVAYRRTDLVDATYKMYDGDAYEPSFVRTQFNALYANTLAKQQALFTTLQNSFDAQKQSLTDDINKITDEKVKNLYTTELNQLTSTDSKTTINDFKNLHQKVIYHLSLQTYQDQIIKEANDSGLSNDFKTNFANAIKLPENFTYVNLTKYQSVLRLKETESKIRTQLQESINKLPDVDKTKMQVEFDRIKQISTDNLSSIQAAVSRLTQIATIYEASLSQNNAPKASTNDLTIVNFGSYAKLQYQIAQATESTSQTAALKTLLNSQKEYLLKLAQLFGQAAIDEVNKVDKKTVDGKLEDEPDLYTIRHNIDKVQYMLFYNKLGTPGFITKDEHNDSEDKTNNKTTENKTDATKNTKDQAAGSNAASGSTDKKDAAKETTSDNSQKQTNVDKTQTENAKQPSDKTESDAASTETRDKQGATSTPATNNAGAGQGNNNEQQGSQTPASPATSTTSENTQNQKQNQATQSADESQTNASANTDVIANKVKYVEIILNEINDRLTVLASTQDATTKNWATILKNTYTTLSDTNSTNKYKNALASDKTEDKVFVNSYLDNVMTLKFQVDKLAYDNMYRSSVWAYLKPQIVQLQFASDRSKIMALIRDKNVDNLLTLDSIKSLIDSYASLVNRNNFSKVFLIAALSVVSDTLKDDSQLKLDYYQSISKYFDADKDNLVHSNLGYNQVFEMLLSNFDLAKQTAKLLELGKSLQPTGYANYETNKKELDQMQKSRNFDQSKLMQINSDVQSALNEQKNSALDELLTWNGQNPNKEKFLSQLNTQTAQNLFDVVQEIKFTTLLQTLIAQVKDDNKKTEFTNELNSATNLTKLTELKTKVDVQIESQKPKEQTPPANTAPSDQPSLPAENNQSAKTPDNASGQGEQTKSPQTTTTDNTGNNPETSTESKNTLSGNGESGGQQQTQTAPKSSKDSVSGSTGGDNSHNTTAQVPNSGGSTASNNQTSNTPAAQPGQSESSGSAQTATNPSSTASSSTTGTTTSQGQTDASSSGSSQTSSGQTASATHTENSSSEQHTDQGASTITQTSEASESSPQGATSTDSRAATPQASAQSQGQSSEASSTPAKQAA
ncbi:hypothetical protein ACR82Z_04420 [Mycoplasma sp. 6243]|uniref:hypothetical protein n=1 Tax=Mycoplasma sp. 6243 TaxID=3440865 RepID=UPI003EBA2844